MKIRYVRKHVCMALPGLSSSVILCAQGWLVDLINKFGTLNGFQILQERFMGSQALNVQIIAALIKYVHLPAFTGWSQRDLVAQDY